MVRMLDGTEGARLVRVLVTGASRGIGAALVERFAARGSRVAALARSVDRLKALVERVGRESGTDALALRCDVTDEEEVEHAIGAAWQAFGGLDVVVHNAGVFETAPLIECSTELWRRTLRTNLDSAFFVFRSVARRMVADECTAPRFLVQIASTAARVGYPRSSAYCASKFGVSGLLAAVREELREHGIRVVNVLPGAVDTSIWDTCGLRPEDGMPDRGAMMSAVDVARAVEHAVLDLGSAVAEEILLRPPCGG